MSSDCMCRKCPNQTYIVKYNKKRHKTLSPIYSISPKRSPISSAHRYSEPNFNKIGRLFTEIWRFNDFQNGGYAILYFKNLQILPGSSCRHAVLLPRTKFRWWIMAKKWIFKVMAAAILNFKNLNFWSRDCNRVQCTKFYQNRTIFNWDMAI